MNPHDRPSTHPRSTANGTGRASHTRSPDLMDAWQKIVGGEPTSTREIRQDLARPGRASGRLRRALRALLGADDSRSKSLPTSRGGSSPFSFGNPFPGAGIPGPGIPGMGFPPPRHAFSFAEETAQPPRVRKQILPLTSGVHILPNESAQITARPQLCALCPERILIGGHPERWVVNEIKVGNRSQLLQSGDLPGKMFALDAIDCSLRLDTVQTAMDFVLIVTYVGSEKDGEPFVASLIGSSVEEPVSPPSPIPFNWLGSDPFQTTQSALGFDSFRAAPSDETETDRASRPGILRTLLGAARGAISTLADAARRALAVEAPQVASEAHIQAPAWSFAPPPPVAFAPTLAHRAPLPVSSGTPVLPNMSAQLTARPQTCAFRPERIVIDNPGDWIVNDVLVGSRSQLAQRGDVPGEAFAHNAIDCSLHMDTVQTAMDFVLVVTYVGDDPKGAPFLCGVLGTTAC